MKKLISIGLAVLIAFQGFWPGSAFCKSRYVVAVLDFYNTTEQETHDYLSRTISEAVATNLGKLKGVELVERGLLVKVFEEMKFAMSGFVDSDTAVEIGHAVGATAVVVGSFSVMGQALRINARVVEVSTGRVLESESAEGKMHRVSEVADQLSEDLWTALTGKKIRKPMYKRWWFWTIVVAAGGTAAAYQQGWPPFVEPLPAPPAPPQ